MRGIKFRGKEILSGKMVYGSYVNYYGTHYISPENDFPSFEVDPETVGQYIGRQDKQGNEIYEGDIVQFEDERVWFPIKIESGKESYFMCFAKGIVTYDPPEYRINKIGKCGINFYDYMGELFSWDDLKIIGNKFENPELTEG